MGKLLLGVGLLALVGCESFEQPPPVGGDPSVPPTDGSGGGFVGPGPVAGTSSVGGGFAFAPSIPGPVFTASRQPPPVSGGTLLVLQDQASVLLADPDRDQLLLVDLATMAVKTQLALAAGAEPGRASEDAEGRVHVVLRGSGQLLTFDPKTGTALATRDVCKYPRGVATQASLVHVACAEGRLLSLSTDPTQALPARDLSLDRDLRDVVAADDGLWVSRFRSAEILKLDGAGSVTQRYVLPGALSSRGASVATVAWRMVARVGGGVTVTHQRALVDEVVPMVGGYGSGGGDGIVDAAVSEVGPDGTVEGSSVAANNPLPVDVAVSPLNGDYLIASAASSDPAFSTAPRSTLLTREQLGFMAEPVGKSFGFIINPEFSTKLPASGTLVAVGFANGQPLMQFREPSMLVYGSQGMTLPGESVTDTGNMLFHLATFSGLACASCHPEGREDGHVWKFAEFGPRRTQSLRGGLFGTEPFHWDGLEADFSALTTDVMSGRMSGPQLSPEQTTAFAHYIDRLPALPAPTTALTPAIEHGKALFEDPNVGCTTCHAGARLMSNLTVDVGSPDGAMQVPSLIGLWARAPYLHDGCAPTLTERFTKCDTGKHGNLTGLSAEDLSDLKGYLETL